MTTDPTGQAAPNEGAASPRAQVFHIELDISTDYPNDHEAFVIIDALTEYASTERWRAEDDTTPHGDHLRELAATADRLRERIDAQMGDANLRDAAG